MKYAARKIPFTRNLRNELHSLNTRTISLTKELNLWKKGFVPPGHYYSTIPDLDKIKLQHAKLFDKSFDHLPGIDLNVSQQMYFLELIKSHYSEMPFPEDPTRECRYYLNNDFYAYADGICLYSILRHLQPRKFIEIGSGFSSAAALDTRDRFLTPETHFTFIEPYPDRLNQLLTEEDKKNGNLSIITSFAQDVPYNIFKSLGPSDILFIDSTHVSRIGSDVNYLFFEILPQLNPGVYVHIHDIFFPFEYPDTWIYDGRFWNECYILRAFLQFNHAFEIVFFNSYIVENFNNSIRESMPLFIKKPTNNLTIPGSIWLRKVN
ncbi:class I SAM-dependent methyltransferase [Aromatoleum evansii]|uniref:class I SAM-dependent methyltransferase n=1 Tax=Aromatoleum evansii TaxID=59406 RepID=UPI00145D4555|nr:class I SAM-dependent methyltransferase [Aromatoleum evansii]NMG28282.1 class I SAM-dependent methyltransferase [Aromatoleum evansii]